MVSSIGDVGPSPSSASDFKPFSPVIAIKIIVLNFARLNVLSGLFFLENIIYSMYLIRYL